MHASRAHASIHSRTYSLASAFRRFFDSGAYAERAYMSGDIRSRTVLRRAAVRYARAELVWLRRTGQRGWIPCAAPHEGSKLEGLRLGRRRGRLPVALKRRASSYPDYWNA